MIGKIIKKPTQTVEIRPGIFFDIPIKDTGLTLIKRRLFQLGLVLFSPRFAPDRDVAKDSNERYSQAQEIAYYKALAHSGFYEPEDQSFKEAQKQNPNIKTALVIGCGTGREAFALRNEGLKVTAFDFSANMIEAAKEMAREKNLEGEINFTTSAPQEKFDLVLITYGLTNHLLSKKERVETLQSFQEYFHEDTVMMYSGYFRQFSFGDRFWIASMLLRLRWLGRKQWEPGLTVISHFGFHNDEAIPLPFYFYRQEDDVRSELIDAGYSLYKVETVEGHPLNHYPNFFVAKIKN